jgi:glyoxylase-like metal-dependent hydrolase (beta-lactamase superfamily II)
VTADLGFPADGQARVTVLSEGYARGGSGGSMAVASTVTLIVDGDSVVVVDPGMVASRNDLLAALMAAGPTPGDVTDVVFSHHHPDHTVNAALFPAARIHDHWATYAGDVWTDRDAEGAVISPSVRLIRTPGHTPEDITTLAAAADGVCACTHAWWGEQGPADDPFAPDRELLRTSRTRILGVASMIIPGHGPAFRVTGGTLR